MSKRKGLGKGLGALIPDEIVEEIVEKVNTDGDLINSVDVNLIIPNKNQPRREFDKEKIEILAESIENHGLIQPIILKKEGGYFNIIAGERRWRAFKILGKSKIPSIIKDVDDFTVSQLALIENIQREDLNIIEEAYAFKELINKYMITQDKVAKIVGKSRSYIANVLRLLSLENVFQDALINNIISTGHAKALMSLKNEEDRKIVLSEIREKDLSVRKTEELVRGFYDLLPVKNDKKTVKSQEVKIAEDDLGMIIGTKVIVKENEGKGKILIDFYSIEDLNRIIEIISKNN